jgi:8-oxo-dGTP pyrophosphatase MutT (NUDIX family)
MVIRGPSGRVLLSTKTFYPPGAYRLPTGGIDRGERVLDALLRETREETGLDVVVRRFLARISYRQRRGSAGAEPPPSLFHTFAFLLDETGGTLGALDPHERLLDYREIAPAELPGVADRLAALGGEDSSDIVGSWGDWGEFRAIVHRVVHESL